MKKKKQPQNKSKQQRPEINSYFNVSCAERFYGPDVPRKVASICSRVLPFVSGTNIMVKTTLMKHIEEKSQKVPALVRESCRLGVMSVVFRYNREL